MNRTDLKSLREKLLRQRTVILRPAVPVVDQPGLDGSDLEIGDAADAAVRNEAREELLNLKEGEKRALGEIEDALTKMRDGGYGICEECGAAIPVKRLSILPQARYCVACQEKLEKEPS